MAKTTREKLIDAALEVFGERGYQHATIQQIVKRAGTNIAAIHYHFGDKVRLYDEVVSHVMTLNQLAEPVDFGDDQTPPEERLRRFIRWFIHHVVGVPHSSAFLENIHMQEMMNPSPLLNKVVGTFIRPNHLKLRAIVAALLPADATEQHVRHHCFSVIGQCLHYRFGMPVIRNLYPDIAFTEDYADVLAKHVADVSLAGMCAARRSTSTTRRSGKVSRA